MPIIIVTPPTFEPVSLSEAKLNLRVDGTDEDSLIQRLISTARRYCEREGRMTIPATTLRLTMDVMPCGFKVLRIPNPPLISVTSIVYIDTAGVSQTMSASLYKVAPGGAEEGRIAPAFGLVWPVNRMEIGAVQITYVAGYSTAAEIPVTTAQAMHLLIGQWYAKREPEGSASDDIASAVGSLLWCERVKI